MRAKDKIITLRITEAVMNQLTAARGTATLRAYASHMNRTGFAGG